MEPDVEGYTASNADLEWEVDWWLSVVAAGGAGIAKERRPGEDRGGSEVPGREGSH